MSLSSARRAAGQQALTALESERAGAYANALYTTDASGGSSRDAALYFFSTTVPASLRSLTRRLDSTDDDTWSSWVSDANELHKSIADVAGYEGEWALSSVLYAAAASTASEVGQGVAAAAAAAKSGTAWGLGTFGLLVLGYVAWKVLK